MNSTLKKTLLLTLPTLLIIFGGVEVALRILKPHFNLEQLTGREEIENPMSKWAVDDPYAAYLPITGAYEKNKTVNSHGFISTPELTLVKSDKTCRVLFLGESSTAGTGTNLADSVTWPWQCVELLKRMPQKFEQLEFINGALGGYSTFESYGRLWSRLRFYKPDVIVINHAWNDMYYFQSVDSIQTFRQGFSVNSVENESLIEPHWIDPFISWSQLLSRARFKLTGGLEQSKAETVQHDLYANQETYDKKALEVYATNIQLIQQFCALNQIELFACKQATLVTSSTSQVDRAKCHYEFHRMNHNAHIQAYHDIYHTIEQLFPSDHIVDLTSLNGISENFYDQVHPTPTGSTRIAQIVADSLMHHYFSVH